MTEQGYTPIHLARRIIIVLVGLVSLLAAIDQLLGPPWPTRPVFSPGLPSTGSPLDIPFSVTNRSIIFPIHHLIVWCQIVVLKTKFDNSITNSNFGMPSRDLEAPDTGTLRVRSAKRFNSCPMTRS